jgi:hypothetical protein
LSKESTWQQLETLTNVVSLKRREQMAERKNGATVIMIRVLEEFLNAEQYVFEKENHIT